ncbi:MAG: tRNA pseudouridine(55) synthase TruB [Candidatus Cloacimonadota bacterium]|nr:MAG: tRNA pseudouridine(55) synthase TruB [Candidatus Cloacimonadota bacterium]PIE77491.1 MAG: tRNA pseudouridine(55) synthase TruB [Candidatus Delongbacteria bacterium]
MKIYSKKDPINIDLKLSSEPFTLLVDKSVDWTSFDVVNKLKRVFSIKKIGHAGTLDPFATGLLIVCFNKATKTISSYQDRFKVYDATIKLGEETDSCDLTGNVVKRSDYIPSSDQLSIIEEKFKGEIEQIPPIFSALKKNGKRMYDLARKGVVVEPDPRLVTIHDYSNIFYEYPSLSFTVKVSKGTYIRSLGRDIAKSINSCGHLSFLRRTAIGEFLVDDAYTISEIMEIMDIS